MREAGLSVSVLLAIDPGACAGWAIFTESGLAACGITKTDCRSVQMAHPSHPTLEPDTLAVELPQIYPQIPGDPNDLITLAFLAGRMIEFQFSVARIRKLHIFKPREWKGQMKKDVCASRVWDRLTPDERVVCSRAGHAIADSYQHNMMDAIGIGLHALGRRLTGG